MPQGKVKWFSTEKAYGFIEQDNDNDIFVHVTGLAEGVTAIDKDMVVEYEVEQGRKGPQAAKVRPVTAPAADAPADDVAEDAADEAEDQAEDQADDAAEDQADDEADDAAEDQADDEADDAAEDQADDEADDAADEAE